MSSKGTTTASLEKSTVLQNNRSYLRNKQWVRPLIGLGAMVLIALVYIPLRELISAEIPFLAVLISFVSFLIPGMALSICFMPDERWLERLPIAMILSLVILSIPVILIIQQHLDIHAFFWMYIILSLITVLVAIFVTYYWREKIGVGEFDPIPVVLVIALVLGTAVLFWISFTMPLIGDDWVAMPWLWHFQTSDQIMVNSVYHGIELPTNIRQEFGVLALDIGLINYFSNLEPIQFYKFLRPLMVIIGIISFYFLTKSLFRKRKIAAFTTIIWIVLLLVSFDVGEGGYNLVVRVLQDKFFLRFIVLTTGLGLLVRYFHSYEWRYLILFGLVTWGAGLTHPLGPVLLGLSAATFGLLHLIINHDRKTLFKLLLVGLLLIIGMGLPLMQYFGAQDTTLSFSTEGGEIDPNFVNRVRLATHAYRLLFQSNGDYTLHPEIILNPIMIFAALSLPFLLWGLKRSIPTRLLLGSFFLVLPLFYIPSIAMIFGKLVTPWLLWRLAWVPELAAWLIISWGVWLVVDIFSKQIRKFNKTAYSIVPILTISAIIILFLPTIQTNLRIVYDIQNSPSQSVCSAPESLLGQLAGRISEDTIILSDRSLNFCIPAYSPWAKVIEYRGISTINRFPLERQDEGWQRLMDALYFGSANFINNDFVDILDRYKVDYIVIQESQLLNLQLNHMKEWFTQVDNRDGFSLYEVEKDRSPNAIVEANSYLGIKDFERAETIYRKALSGPDDDQFLGNLGLSEISLVQGQIQQSIRHLDNAIALYPSHGLVYAQLASIRVADQRLIEAVKDYEMALANMPEDVTIMQNLASAYQAIGEIDKADELTEIVLGLQAPLDSYDYRILLGQYFNQTQAHEQAISEYKKAADLIPSNVEPWVLIGNTYLTLEDPIQAKASFDRGSSIDRWSPLLRVGLAQLSESQEDYELARDYYKESIRLDPVNPISHQLLVNLLDVTTVPEEAANTLKSLLSYKLELPTSYASLGDIYVANDNIDEAIRFYDIAIAKNPLGIGDYLLRKSNAYSQIDNNSEAIETLNQALDLGASPIQVHTATGRIYQNEGKRDKAIGQVLVAVRNNPYSASIHNTLARTYLSFHEWDDAISESEIAINLAPDSNIGYLSLADTYLAMGRFEDALDRYFFVLELQPQQSTQVLLKIAEVYEDLEEYELAREILRDAEELNIDMGDVSYALGKHYSKLVEPELAIGYFEKAIELEPSRADAYNKLSDILISLGRINDSAKILGEAINIIPESVTSYDKLASIELLRGNPDAALSWLEKGLNSNPQNGAAYLNLADEYKRRGKVEKAMVYYEQSIVLDLRLSNAYSQLANLYIHQNTTDKAEDLYKKWIEAIPYASDAYYDLGDLYVQQERFEDAKISYETGLNIIPVSISGYQSLSKLYQVQGEWNSAIETLESAKQIFPSSTDILLDLAELYKRRGEFDKAQKIYEDIKNFSSTTISAYENLANLHEASGNLDKAQQILEEAVTNNPTSAQALKSLATHTENHGDIDTAEVLLIKGIHSEPGNDQAYQFLNQFYLRQNRYDEALETALNTLDVPLHTTGIYVAIANTYLAMGRQEEAISWFEWALQSNPIDIGPRLELASYYQSNYEWNSALDYAESAIMLQPNNAFAALTLGNIHLQMKNYDAAEIAFESACSSDPLMVSCYISLGNLHKNKGQWSEAIDQYKQAIKISPTEFLPYSLIAQVYSYQEMHPEALEIYAEGILNTVDKQTAYLARANYYETRGNLNKARDDFETAQIISPRTQSSVIQLANFYERRGEIQEARTILENFAVTKDAEVELFINLGNLYAHQAEWDAALQAFQHGIELDEKAIDAYVGVAQVYRKHGKINQALRYYLLATLKSPEDPQSFINLGDEYLRRLDYISAEKAYQKASELDPSSAAVLIKNEQLSRKRGEQSDYLIAIEDFANNNYKYGLYTTLAYQYQQRGEWDAANDWYQKALETDPNNMYIWYLYGGYHKALRNWDKALESYNNALKYEPNSHPFLLALGSVYYNLEQYDEAIQAYNKAIEADQSQIYGYVALANVYQTIEDPDQAKEILQYGLKLIPSGVEGYQNLGALYSDEGDVSEALHIYLNGLEINPGAAGLFVSQADLFGGEVLEAIEQYKHALDIHNYAQTKLFNALTTDEGEIAKAYLDLTESFVIDTESEWLLLQETGRQTEIDIEVVRDLYLDALKIAPENVNALLGLGRLYASTDDMEKAVKYYQDAVDKNPTSVIALNTTALFYKDLERYDDAVDLYQTALKFSPTNIGSHLGLFRSYRDSENRTLAQAAYPAHSGQYIWFYLIEYLRSRL